ncbi:MAG: metallophosphoesterase [Turneriella sp.]|nr:metallophosphoesterase [Leptospiraceae bacterium]MCX7633126.1 metallophosphoesterase [Turneriella sp.]
MPTYAILGDLHLQFDEDDVEFFNNSDYDALLFVGDLAARMPESLFKLLPLFNALTKPSYLIPGNHDTTGVRALLGELWQNEFLIQLGAASQPARMERLKKELRHTTLCGYSLHGLPGGLNLVAARPFSMGSTNGTVNFRPYLERTYGVRTLAESSERLKSLIDGVHSPYIILAHHGPHGLGPKATDIWGADFLPQEVDFGDPDLADAISYAISIGKPPLAVIAGHMHYPTKHGKKPKQWYLYCDGVLYVNAARWPRIFLHNGRRYHHHIALETDGKTASVFACYVTAGVVHRITDALAILPD